MNVDAVVRRAYLLLEDGDFSRATELLNQALNEEPENAAIYVGLLCAELKVHSENELANCKVPIADHNNFKKAVRFGDDVLVKRLNEYNTQIVNNLALEHKKREYSSAMSLFTIIENNPEATHEQCIGKAASLYELARRLRSLGDHEDSIAIADRCERQAEELKVLAEQLKQESLTFAAAKKKNKIKRLCVTGVVVALIIIGLFTYIKVNGYIKSLPGKYYGEYKEAFNNGDYIKAQNYYKKYLDIIKEEEGSSGTLDDVIALCNLAKISEEGLQAFVEGDFEKGKELFAKEVEREGWMWKASLYYVPHNIIKELLPQLLEKLNPVQIQIANYGYYATNELYWLNSDGTVGTIDGHPSVSDWKDIVEIKANGDTVAGLAKDGTLIYKSGEYETQTIREVISFDVDDYIVAVVKNDGTVTYTREVTGSEFVDRWTNVKNVRIIRGSLRNEYLEGKEIKDQPYTGPGFEPRYLVAQTNEGAVLTSGYHKRIYPPDEEALVKDVVNSIQNAPSWGTVLDPASRATLQRPLRDGYTQVMIPASLDTDFSKPTELRLKLYGIDIPVSQDSNGNWIIR